MKFRHSLKFKLTMIMAAVVTAVVVIVCVLNTIFFEKYYISDREKTLVSSYEALAKQMEDGTSDEELVEEIRRINALHGVNVFILDSNWVPAYSTQFYSQDAVRWMQDFIFAMDDTEILAETEQYTVQKGYDSGNEMSYLVVSGTVSDGASIVMQLVLENIRETVSICNRFVILVGVGVLIVSILAVYILADRFTRPVKELSTLAGEMSEMNFEAHYTGKDRGEIGMLGNSMNIMADRLQENIGELKAANLALKKDLELRDRNEQMRREFIANVSHELKTPIALIQGYAEGLKEGMGDAKEDRDYYCDVIMDESGKMNHLVMNLLTLNQLEYGHQSPQIERFDLSSLIRDVVRANGLRFDQENITLSLSCDEAVYVWADELQIEEVLTNYITNAFHYCSGEKRICLDMERRDKTVRVNVFNTGSNIPEESLDRIWEKFYKVDKARTREYGGNGIGLSIVKAIMDNHNGRCGVENQTDGVTFYFELECE